MTPKRQPDKVLTEAEWEALVLSEDLKDYIKPDGTLDLDALADDAEMQARELASSIKL